MITRLFSAALRGFEAQEVEVEVNARGADKPVVINVGKTYLGGNMLMGEVAFATLSRAQEFQTFACSALE